MSLVENVEVNTQKVKFTTALLPTHPGITSEGIVDTHGINEFKLLGDMNGSWG